MYKKFLFLTWHWVKSTSYKWTAYLRDEVGTLLACSVWFIVQMQLLFVRSSCSKSHGQGENMKDLEKDELWGVQTRIQMLQEGGTLLGMGLDPSGLASWQQWCNQTAWDRACGVGGLLTTQETILSLPRVSPNYSLIPCDLDDDLIKHSFLQTKMRQSQEWVSPSVEEEAWPGWFLTVFQLLKDQGTKATQQNRANGQASQPLVSDSALYPMPSWGGTASWSWWHCCCVTAGFG